MSERNLRIASVPALRRVETVLTALDARMRTIRMRSLDAEHHDDILFALDAIEELAIAVHEMAKGSTLLGELNASSEEKP